MSWELLIHRLGVCMCVRVFYVLSPSPCAMSSCRARTGRSVRLSPWFTRASFRTSNPFNTTSHFWPIRRLYTCPYFPANCEWIWERTKSMLFHMTDNWKMSAISWPVAFWMEHLLIYLCQTLMGPVVVQSEYVANNWKSYRSWRKVDRPTVLNIICSEDENYCEEQQTLDLPVQTGSDCRNDWIHSADKGSSLSNWSLCIPCFSRETKGWCCVANNITFLSPVREKLGGGSWQHSKGLLIVLDFDLFKHGGSISIIYHSYEW